VGLERYYFQWTLFSKESGVVHKEGCHLLDIADAVFLGKFYRYEEAHVLARLYVSNPMSCVVCLAIGNALSLSSE
jgi:hypothetical protein